MHPEELTPAEILARSVASDLSDENIIALATFIEANIAPGTPLEGKAWQAIEDEAQRLRDVRDGLDLVLTAKVRATASAASYSWDDFHAQRTTRAFQAPVNISKPPHGVAVVARARESRPRRQGAARKGSGRASRDGPLPSSDEEDPHRLAGLAGFAPSVQMWSHEQRRLGARRAAA